MNGSTDSIAVAVQNSECGSGYFDQHSRNEVACITATYIETSHSDLTLMTHNSVLATMISSVVISERHIYLDEWGGGGL